MKKYFLITVSIGLVGLLLSGCESPQQLNSKGPSQISATLSSDKNEYKPGEIANVKYLVNEIGAGAWIGIIPSRIAHGTEEDGDANDIDYQYITEVDSAVEFTVPTEPGEYDFRLYDRDGINGVELGYTPFTVKKLDKKTITLEILNNDYKTGEEIEVSFSGADQLSNTAWIGIVPSNVEHGSESINDENDKDYEYLKGEAAGTRTLTAPDETGEYDIRLNSADTGNAEEVTYISFNVVDDDEAEPAD